MMIFLKKIFNSKKNIGLTPYKKVPWMTDLRLKNLSICLNAGFKPAVFLPIKFDKEPRPLFEIAQRLNAIKALVLWLMVSQKKLGSDKIIDFIHKNNLENFMDKKEKEILNTPRDDEQARNFIGWKFENAWSLAWYFGYKKPDIMGEVMFGYQMQEILANFSCPLNKNVREWAEERVTISREELIKMEDLFYCLHNAVRRAQLGGDTVPNGFNPIENGKIIHERRHSLTWMLSKSVVWEKTNLSTEIFTTNNSKRCNPQFHK